MNHKTIPILIQQIVPSLKHHIVQLASFESEVLPTLSETGPLTSRTVPATNIESFEV